MESPPDLDQQLTELRAIIKQADSIAATTVSGAGQRISLVVQAGHKLIEIRKTVGHGKWAAWIEENLRVDGRPVSRVTVHKWIRAAEYCKREGFDPNNARSIRQLFQLAELLPEPNDPQPSKTGEGTTYLLYVDKLLIGLKGLDIDNMEQSQRATIASRLRPIAEFHALLIS